MPRKIIPEEIISKRTLTAINRSNLRPCVKKSKALRIYTRRIQA
jgi:hypothetical protein